ncbi:MAG: hypothetical protein A2261_03045 [Candidatus Magasanikbacteria bacterium RIFOXYA2_FULL_44_8]|uniref:DUF5666 domain-containing protein n=1 Tax=Candidatus Magasanikbacteria bacterium RIFOXYA2_FULL_44_8 TaxID=1798696 RepID=A0A1F6NKT5_9BACT|nr:MAG: hypothetical protein A2261_03045 [Candidatus Magasanikbacteria bacterium RIFOXYA2_FULL_44_8]
MSKYFIGVLAIVALLVTAGCSVVVNNSVNNNDGSKDNATGTLRAGGGNRNPQAELFKNLPKGTVADLVVGKNVQITGTTNSDETVNAARIMIGAMPDFERRGITSSTQPTATGTPGQGRMRGGNGQGYGGRIDGAGRGNTAARVIGQILSKDVSSLTIKSSDGGTKIAFFSDSTEFYIFQPPTSTHGNAPIGTPPTP